MTTPNDLVIGDFSGSEGVVVSPDFRRPSVDLTHGMYFRIVSPARVSSFIRDVEGEHFQATLDELREKIFARLHVVHAALSDEIVVTIISVNLVSNRAEQTIAISFHLYD